MEFKLRFDPKMICDLSAAYSYPDENNVKDVISPAVLKRGYYTKDEFLKIGVWKSPRNKKRHENNEEEFIKAVTATSLSVENERLRIEVPTLLEGVSWPTASVLLHFGHPDPYPILDFRALWSLGVDVPADSYNFYDFDLWWSYTQYCRDLAAEWHVSMRVLDRALWQYSKVNQINASVVPENDLME